MGASGGYPWENGGKPWVSEFEWFSHICTLHCKRWSDGECVLFTFLSVKRHFLQRDDCNQILVSAVRMLLLLSNLGSLNFALWPFFSIVQDLLIILHSRRNGRNNSATTFPVYPFIAVVNAAHFTESKAQATLARCDRQHCVNFHGFPSL